MVFCGEVVVNCVVNRGGLRGFFLGLKISLFCKFFCGKVWEEKRIVPLRGRMTAKGKYKGHTTADPLRG
jgi:hypothetical protein